MSILQVLNLTKIYLPGSKIAVRALDRANIKVEKGEFVAIVGPSGSGKSTLLYLLGGLERQSEGKIIVNNKDLTTLTEDELAEYRRKEIGFVFQKYNLIPILNAKENIVLPLSIGGEKIDDFYFDKIVKLLGIEDRLEHMPNELSGGQQQRVSIARALIGKPSIILADEPTGNLDYKASEDIVNFFKQLSAEFGQTIVMITHDKNLASKADRIIEIIDGKVMNQ
ncbi:ABC transporter ATP-binding protein [Velocimicrobium porci]|uniref:ABC transporter ATP-binding protein n=1 Tax=Velocimicrobium porci TaxID=2606634 RepID=A0A6L5XXD8_9FIRM|nr:ABC transporter ATP-binding protein [Velocimicrobium porci]MSS63412.1 ABC transporter ATP-binding protein [Velocimicrobium porci]